ncbi:hypothetical protein GCM10023063_37430 [Arthrobacter methylotrophus]
MWLPRTAVSVDAFHLVKLGKDMLTEVRERLAQQVHGRRGRSIDPVWANRRLLLRGGDTLSDRARNRLSTVLGTDGCHLEAADRVAHQVAAPDAVRHRVPRRPGYGERQYFSTGHMD